MFSKRTFLLVMLSVVWFQFSQKAEARDAARDLRSMVGWTIIDSTIVTAVDRASYDTVLRLSNGRTVKLSACVMLPPLPMSDAIVFGKKVGSGYLLRIMIDNEVCDIGPV
jgi:hypothetical protein